MFDQRNFIYSAHTTKSEPGQTSRYGYQDKGWTTEKQGLDSRICKRFFFPPKRPEHSASYPMRTGNFPSRQKRQGNKNDCLPPANNTNTWS